jgi:hypothetical protein
LRKLIAGTALACVATLVATTAFAGGLVRVSGPSPYAACTVIPPSDVFANTSIEGSVAANPTNTSNLVGAWQQDRLKDSAARGVASAASFDGGSTWRETTVPLSRCAPSGAAYDRATNASVTFGHDGLVYAGGLAFDNDFARNAINAAVSRDGGRTWTGVSSLIADTASATTGHPFNFKPFLTADPNRAGVAYAVWDRLSDVAGGGFTGPTFFSKTTDGGQHWQTARAIVDPGTNNQTIGNVLVVNDESGRLYDFFNMQIGVEGANGQRIEFVTSDDGGATWSQPHFVVDMQVVKVTDPNTGQGVETGDTFPQPAIDPETGQLYVVWQTTRFSAGAFDEVAITTSSDGGVTWSAPARLSTATGRAAFTPSISVSEQGRVAVTYYDFRNLQAGNTTTLPTDNFLKTSPRGGAAFGADAHLAGSFDMMLAPTAEDGFHIGAYQGLTFGSGGTVHPFFAITNPAGSVRPTDILTTSLP